MAGSSSIGSGSGKGMKRATYKAPPSTTSLGYPATSTDPSKARRAKQKLNQKVKS
jgi:hypothetical protein